MSLGIMLIMSILAQVATVSFRNEPKVIVSCFPGTPVYIEAVFTDNTVYTLIVDCDFFGLTPLYSSPSPSVE
jgi:hypothetical protein